MGEKSWCFFGSKRLCGFRPTGRLHLGHYFAVIKPGLTGANVLVANYHAPHVTNVAESVATIRGFGVTNVVMQTDVFRPELYFRLLSLAKIGDLSRMTQYQSSSEDSRTAQIMTYPVLMAHDVAGYDEVMVGDDQMQHLRYASKLLRKYNSQFGETLAIPRVNCIGGRIMDLRHPEKKMSKSNPQGCLFLDDAEDTIRRKLKAATSTPYGLANLHTLHREFVGGEIPMKNEEMKKSLAEGLIAAFARS